MAGVARTAPARCRERREVVVVVFWGGGGRMGVNQENIILTNTLSV